ncbi:MAG: radical SAM protein [Gordonibacter sp.]
MERAEYCEAFERVNADFEATVASYGLPFEEEAREDRALRCAGSHWISENGGASLRGGNGWLSPACVACRTGERTVTFFASLRCPKNCYFCFNPNQEDYERFLQEKRDMVRELEQAHAAGACFEYLAITGGEPMLHEADVLAFLERAGQLYPAAHTRLYTSGYGIDEGSLGRLTEAGLDEIRFSIKLEDDDRERDELRGRIALAVGRGFDVMVEMPVIPGTLEVMKRLLLDLAAIGACGINLLEFCFPLDNAPEFAKRGFKLRKQPYRVLYNYWYAGGLPLADSEAEALELLRFAADEQLDLGVHYCSSDNKNSGQLFQQNAAFLRGGDVRERYAYLSFDGDDFLLKCAKAFGSSVEAVRAVLDELAVKRSEPIAYEIDDAVPMISFPLVEVSAITECLPGAELAQSSQVLEPDDAGYRLRELAVEPLQG